ncbi:flagellar hook protein FlgE [Thiomicrorhabdus sediminis]|uniref:Flagellar hook protein FlgE n=1 Tax=Thiomicrorhabdus sediminis TaxID=2580412 RepID=A0A4P9K667_9GAMM|nr:flagellar hook protein FlgE [Thiomicrorhabdus sediminis]QCU90489.1 flagellar hook protein FlgE [Thiomicrorhabdus sediminis]
MGGSYDLNALSGINAASNGLGVISNNLANAQSVGFKGSRAEFADLFSGAQNSPGSGVRVAAITQDFGQGTINGTGRELDMAVDGEGFFILEDKTGRYDNVYTRNGSFKLDKDGYLTSQEGNRVQGYRLNETLSTEANPVFDTTLSSIDLDALNREPRATDEMTFDINLNGELPFNVDPQGTNTGVAATDDSIGSTTNLDKLFQPDGASGAYTGFPDFSTTKDVYDSLGGEHRLTINFYKRDVVPADDGAGNAISNTDANGVVPAAAGTQVKYTSWLVQYTMQDYNDDTGQWENSGHVSLPDGTIPNYAATGAGASGQVYEMRFNTSGELMGVYQPDDGAGNYDITNNGAGIVGVAGSDVDTALAASNLNWTKTANQPKLHFVIDTPLTGATDPLGGETATAGNFEIDLSFDDMTQFSGSNNLRGVTQNGFKIGDLVGLTTGLDGVIEARYSNGRSIPVAQLGLANFSDKNGMEKLGGQMYAENFTSGTVQLGTPQNNGFGTIQAGSLEYSNVDVAGELVNMIQTQRTYQASAQVISTSQTLTQTILNL